MAFAKPPVHSSEDFRRVQAIPERGADFYPRDLVQKLTAILRTPTGTQTLFDVQARALYDAAKGGKGFYPIKVGGGKTLISFLLPVVLHSKRPLLVIPAAMLEETERKWREAMKDWQVAKHLVFKSYEWLSRVSGSTYLEFYKPDLLITDEAHKIKNPKAAVTRRFRRYMEGHQSTRYIPMSGTIMKSSVKDYAHLMGWALRETSLLPHSRTELDAWAGALDEGLNPAARRSAGVLLDLFREPAASDPPPSTGGEYDDLDNTTEEEARRARRIYFARANATLGVVSADSKDDYTGSLLIESLEYKPNEATEANFKMLREQMCKPDGWALADAMQVWAEARRLILGLHYTWDPLPPEEWLQARKLWAKFVRDTLADPRSMNRGWDSELQVMTAVLHGELEDDFGLLDEWRRIKDTFTINPKPVWHDDTALKVCEQWLSDHDRGICWVEHRFFGAELAKRTGLSYFGPKGLDSNELFIQDASGPIIASIAANSTGRNLQHKWQDNLITAPAADSDRWEQLIARSHRPGQKADSVTVDVLVACREQQESLPRALRSATVKKDLLGFSQKLKLADIVWPPKGGVGPRWS